MAKASVPTPDYSEVLKELAIVQKEFSVALKNERYASTPNQDRILERRKQLIQKIPFFWKTAILNQKIGPVLKLEDRQILSYLVDVTAEDIDLKIKHFKVVLHFSENPFFYENVVVVEHRPVETDPDEHASYFSPVSFKVRPAPEKKMEISTLLEWLNDSVEEDESSTYTEAIRNRIWPNPLTLFQRKPRNESTGSPLKGYFPPPSTSLSVVVDDTDSPIDSDTPTSASPSGTDDNESPKGDAESPKGDAESPKGDAESPKGDAESPKDETKSKAEC